MLENPFEQSTLVTDFSQPGSGNSLHGIQVCYPSAQRKLVPAVLALSGLIMPVILFFVLQPPINAMAAGITAVSELGAAAFMYLLFNSAVVRADDSGVTRSQLGKAQSVRWEEISSIEYSEVANSPQTKFTLRDAAGKAILEFSDFGNKKDGLKLRDFIKVRLENRR